MFPWDADQGFRSYTHVTLAVFVVHPQDSSILCFQHVSAPSIHEYCLERGHSPTRSVKTSEGPRVVALSAHQGVALLDELTSLCSDTPTEAGVETGFGLKAMYFKIESLNPELDAL